MDLSAGGVQIELEGDLEPEARCQVTLPRELGYLRLQARVRRCVPHPDPGREQPLSRVGLEFVAVDETTAEDLSDAIADFQARQTTLSTTAQRLRLTVDSE